MVASGDDIEMMCGILTGNLKERPETTEPVMEGKVFLLGMNWTGFHIL